MARGPKKHMKRMFAPKHWHLTKLGGVYATRPSTGPHKMRQCIPMSVLLRSRLKYALSGHECIQICKDKDNAHIRVDNKIRRDHRFPLGLMDVVSIKLNLITGDIDACLKFENGACVFIRGGNNVD